MPTVTARMPNVLSNWSADVGPPAGGAAAWANTTNNMESPRVSVASGVRGAVAVPERACEALERAAFDGFAHDLHQCLVKRDVVQGQHSVGQHLSRNVKMAQVGAAELTACGTGARGIERPGITGVDGVSNVQGAIGRERHPVPRVPR